MSNILRRIHFTAARSWQFKSYRFPKISSYYRKEGEHFFTVWLWSFLHLITNWSMAHKLQALFSRIWNICREMPSFWSYEMSFKGKHICKLREFLCIKFYLIFCFNKNSVNSTNSSLSFVLESQQYRFHEIFWKWL